MEYVLVPVPEEHVVATRQYLQWNVGKIELETFDLGSIVRFLDAIDSTSRTLILLGAERADEVRPLTTGDAADALGCSVREVLGLILEVNEAVRLAGGPPFVLVCDVRPGIADTEVRDWHVNMPGDLARQFLKATGRGSAGED